jgi:flagellin
MESQLRGIKMAIRNSQDGISLVQTAESGMGEISNMVLRMRELAVQMENGIYTAKDRDNAQLEVNALLQEIDKIAGNTRFNDVKLLDGAYDQTIRAGNTNAETIRVAIDALTTAGTAKITEFAVEKGAIQTGGDIGLTDGAAATYGWDSTAGGTAYSDSNAGNAKTLVQAYAKARTEGGYHNLSTDGADGVDADGGDTDLSVVDGVSFAIDTSVFSSDFKSVFKGDSLGTFSIRAMSTAESKVKNNQDGNASSAGADTSFATDHAKFEVDAKTGKVTLKAGQDIDFTASAVTDPMTDANSLTAAIANNYSFVVDYHTRAAAGGAASHSEFINLVVTKATESALDAIEVETSAKATRAIETLDKSLEEVSSAQAKLGAIQNRLQHNIDNLSKSAMLTEQSVGRVVDADFATETSNLSKQQILNQAATAMLAQANQSKQSVLSLLQ